MKIIYIANHGNQILDDTEGHISYGFRKLGHEVIEIQENQAEVAREMAGDLILFHHWDRPERFDILNSIKGIKAFWYFDKVWGERPKIIQDNLKVVDYAFMVDGTYVKQYSNVKFRVLRQGIGDRLIEQGLGNPRPTFYQGEIGFTGGIYSEERRHWAAELREYYGDRFVIYNNIYNRDLFDLCATLKIMLAPPHPSDDHYWGNRVYLMTGSGGFLIHPYCKDLTREYKDRKHIVYYDPANIHKLCAFIDYYLDNSEEREKIRLAGFERTKEKFTFTHRVKELLGYL